MNEKRHRKRYINLALSRECSLFAVLLEVSV